MCATLIVILEDRPTPLQVPTHPFAPPPPVFPSGSVPGATIQGRLEVTLEIWWNHQSQRKAWPRA